MFFCILIEIFCLYICLFVYIVVKIKVIRISLILLHIMALTTGRKNGFVQNLLFANITQLLKKLRSKYWAKMHMVNATFEYQNTGGVNC